MNTDLGQLLVLWTQSQDTKPGEMYEDSGCNRCVAGKDVHKTWQRYLAEYGLKAERLDKQEEFVFGNGKSEMSDCAFNYPVFLSGRIVGSIDVARIPVDCPALFSKRMMKTWKMTLDFEKQLTRIGEFKCTVPFRNTVPVLDVLQLPEHVELKDIPPCFHFGTPDSPHVGPNRKNYASTTTGRADESDE